VTRASRVWVLQDLLETVPQVQRGRPFVWRCKETTTGHGRYVKDVDSGKQIVDVELEISPADTLSVAFGHDWPPELSSDEVTELERLLLHGLVEALALTCDLAFWGCSINVTSVQCGAQTPALGLKIAAVLAVQYVVNKADWSPYSPSDPEAA
jgi:hypothetical protein